MPRTPQAYEVLDAYRDAPRRDRLGVKVRWLTSPVAAFEKQVPRSGRILDVGCGDGLVGLYLAVCGPDREVLGVDVDAAGIALAHQAVPYLGDRAGSVTFEVVEPSAVPEGLFDVVVIEGEERHLLGSPSRRSVLAACVDRLAPGGTILTGPTRPTRPTRPTGPAPRWKAAIAGA